MEVPGKEWTVREWRPPRRGEIVRHDSGTLGRVIDFDGSWGKKTLKVLDEKDSEIYTDEPAELFWVESGDISRDFHVRRYQHKNLSEKKICSVTGAPGLPMMIEKLEWLSLYQRMRFWLRDMSSPINELIKTDDESLLIPFEIGLPTNLEAYLSNYASGLDWKIEGEELGGWGSHGEPHRFSTESKALNFVDAIKSRLIIRRVSSVIGGQWSPDFENENQKKYIVMTRKNSRCYVKEVVDSGGNPAYFETPMHAAFAIEVIGEENWIASNLYENDNLKI